MEGPEFMIIVDPHFMLVCSVIGTLILVVGAIVMTTMFIRRSNRLDQPHD